MSFTPSTPTLPKAAPTTVPSPASKPVKLVNLLTNEQSVDQLHKKCKQDGLVTQVCTQTRCMGSLMNPKSTEQKLRSVQDLLEQAREFIDNFYGSTKRLNSAAHLNRWTEVEEQIHKTGTYHLTETELSYGAKLAWRNAPRCIGRIQWSKLQVFDARFITDMNEFFEALCNHIRYATNMGCLRSTITIFRQRVKSAEYDWKIWNSQLISYAGYRNRETGEVTGDPKNVEMTEICQRLGWKGKGGRFDVLPLVLSANGGPPELFPLPEDLILRVKIVHPRFNWFAELGLEWYALPAVANMMLDVGGLQFPAAPFSGWYMVTEIGSRDLGDVTRYNMLGDVAQRMGLDTSSNASLWKDQAMVELNVAVLYSYQKACVTIVDHHTASESFMTHLSNEQRLRGGCPADWVWIVPPTSASCTAVYHQEMLNYHRLPNYEYQEPVWAHFDWAAWEAVNASKKANKAESSSLSSKRRGSQVSGALPPSPTKVGLTLLASGRLIGDQTNGELTPRKRFKDLIRAVKFTSKLFGVALSRRIKVTIVYASETGKSERYAHKLAQKFSSAFNVHVMSMSDYDMTCLEHETLILVVTATFGNGEPPENGQHFAKHLAAVKLTGDTTPDIDSLNAVSSNPFFQMLSEDNKDSHKDDNTSLNSGVKDAASEKKTSDGLKTALVNREQMNIRPFSNVRFGVFALGSTAYPHFCAFGRYVDQTLCELGAERILKCSCGDELSGQEKAFNEWSNEAFKNACDVFCLTDFIGPLDRRPEHVWNTQDVRFVPFEKVSDALDSLEKGNGYQNTPVSITKKSVDVLSNMKEVVRNLAGITNKKIVPFSVTSRNDLHPFLPEENLQTICLDLHSEFISGATSARLVTPSSILSLEDSFDLPGGPHHKTQVRKQLGSAQTGQISFEAGDHIALFPKNKPEMVEKLMERMRADSGPVNQLDFEKVYTVLMKRDNMDLTPASAMAQVGLAENGWIPHDRLPVCSIREALTRYLDITSTPNQEFLMIISRLTADLDEKKRLQQMARSFTVYEQWKNRNVPTLLSLLEEFKTVKFEPALLTQLAPMKPRFYSVSGVSVSLTVGVVRFKTSSGAHREGLCSNYLNSIEISPTNFIYGYIRPAPAFHMPQNKSEPMILISAGTGIAPFRSFWQQRYIELQEAIVDREKLFGRVDLYFGCRNSHYILYAKELDKMHEEGVLSSINIAFSRPIERDIIDDTSAMKEIPFSSHRTELNNNRASVKNIKQACKRIYVQDKLLEHKDHVHKMIMMDKAHVYVCGDVAMADGVYKTLATILGKDGEGELMNLRNINRYHEDIFGAKQNA